MRLGSERENAEGRGVESKIRSLWQGALGEQVRYRGVVAGLERCAVTEGLRCRPR